MGNCCSNKPKEFLIQQPQNSKKVTERTENEQKIELPLSKHSDSTKPQYIQPQSQHRKISENSKPDLLMHNVELFSLEHQLIYRNTKFSNLYTLMPKLEIAKGTAGKVLAVQHNTTGIIRAAKIIKNQLDKKMIDVVIQKVQGLRKLDHPNLVQITDFFVDDQHLYLVTEYCQGGNINGRIKEIQQFKNPEVFNISSIFKQILSALMYLHQQKLLHKNLNPKKILFTQKLGSIIKLVDYNLFEMSLFLEEDQANDFSYMPPEYFKNLTLYTSASDIWSCGVMLLQTLTGTHPFKDINKNTKKTQRNIMRGTFPQGNEWDQLPIPAKQLIVQMLQFYPKDRPTAKQCLNSKYFSNSKPKLSSSKSFINVNALRQLKIYNSDSKLRTLFLNIMVNRQMSQKEREALTSVFQKIDTNNDGKISKTELKELLLETLNPEAAQIELDKIFNSLDGNNNGYLDFNEFLVAACDQKEMLNKKNLDEFFNLIDRDRSNDISAKEISKLFCNTTITNEQWKKLLQDADINHDGHISKEEFYQLMEFQRSKN